MNAVDYVVIRRPGADNDNPQFTSGISTTPTPAFANLPNELKPRDDDDDDDGNNEDPVCPGCSTKPDDQKLTEVAPNHDDHTSIAGYGSCAGK